MCFRRRVSDFGMYVMGARDDALYLALYVDDFFMLCLHLKRITGFEGRLGG